MPPCPSPLVQVLLNDFENDVDAAEGAIDDETEIEKGIEELTRQLEAIGKQVRIVQKGSGACSRGGGSDGLPWTGKERNIADIERKEGRENIYNREEGGGRRERDTKDCGKGRHGGVLLCARVHIIDHAHRCSGGCGAVVSRLMAAVTVGLL